MSFNAYRKVLQANQNNQKHFKQNIKINKNS